MLREGELAARANGQIELHAGIVRVQWDLPELITADGYAVRGRFTCNLRLLSDPNEMKMLAEALLSTRSVVSVADVIEHFSPSIRAAAQHHAPACSAEEMLTDIGRQNFTSVLLEAAKPIAFVSGLELMPPILLELDCPALGQQRFAQRRAAEQAEQLQRSAQLLEQFQVIRRSAPDLPAGQILQRISPADQAGLLRSLLLASAATADRLWAAAGPNLIEIPAGPSPTPRLIPLPGDLGPLRSVRGSAEGWLLLGGRGGVAKVQPDSSAPAPLYRDPQVLSQLGFNGAVIPPRGDRLWASHGEAGLICWDLDRPDQPRCAIRPGSAQDAFASARNLAVLDQDRLIFSAGPHLMVVLPDDSVRRMGTGPADILAIFVQPQRIVVVREDGQICVHGHVDLAETARQTRAGRLSAAGALPWLGESRLLLAGVDGPILCVALDDDLTTQYASAHLAPRIVAGSAARVAAVTSDRQRLILWDSWLGHEPGAQLHLAAVAKHRIADLAFA